MKLEASPLVSVIMPAYNAQGFIEEAIRSVQAQTVTDWELLVLDDGSSDATVEIVSALAQEDPRIRFLKNEQNMGTARTRNRALELSRGRYLAFLDCDDLWRQDKLERQLEKMQQTGAALCYTSYAVVDENGKKAKADYLVPEQVDFQGLLRENVIGCSTVVLDSQQLGPVRFETDYYHEDYILWLNLLSGGCTVCGCGECLTQWRLLSTSRSYNKRRSACNRWRIYRNYLKLPFMQSLRMFAAYAAASLRKYR